MSGNNTLIAIPKNVQSAQALKDRHRAESKVWADHDNASVAKITAYSLACFVRYQLASNQPLEVRKALADWINEADSTNPVAVKLAEAHRNWKTIAGGAFRNDEAYVGPAEASEFTVTDKDGNARLDENGEERKASTVRVSLAAAAAWALWLVETHEDVTPETFAVAMDRRDLNTATRLARLGISRDEIKARFPGLVAQSKVRKERKERRLNRLGGESRAKGRGMTASAPAPQDAAPSIDPLAVVDALMAAGWEYPVAREIAGKGCKTVLDLLDALMAVDGVDYGTAREIAAKLA